MTTVIDAVNHLWQSTLFAAAAGLSTLALRRNHAQTRYWLWFAASIKFLVPFSLLMMVGSHFVRWTPPPAATSNVSLTIEQTIDQVSEPFAVAIPIAPAPAAQSSLIPAILFAAWAIGFVTLVCSWCLRWRRVRAAVRAASPLHLPIDMQAVSSPAFPEPGVIGVFRPILLLPEGLVQRLTPPQLEAIPAHELCHVRRRDNLAALVHMAVEAVFWFHPLVWYLGARLMEERELACDEEVLRMGSQPEVYADGILKICELYLGMQDEAPLECVAGVTGADLKKRIETIMTNRVVLKLSFAKKAALAVAGIAAVAAPIVVGVMNAPRLQAQSQKAAAPDDTLKFEVASVRGPSPLLGKDSPFQKGSPVPAGGTVAGGPGTSDPERITYTRVGMMTILRNAFELAPDQFSGPSWLSEPGDPFKEDRYDIAAKVPPGTTKEQANIMLQNLLKERLGLKFHIEKRDFDVYALVVARNGPKLKPAQEADGPPPAADPNQIRTFNNLPPSDYDGFPQLPPGIPKMTGVGRDGSMKTTARMQTMEKLAQWVGFRIGNNHIVDKTGLTGKYDFNLEFSNQSDEVQATLFAALEQQLGLKVEKSKAPLDVVVIDHIDKIPTPN